MDRIVIGTGRCGSTLLSDMLAEHPDGMVLSEFFVSTDPARGWPDGNTVTAESFVELLERTEPVGSLYASRSMRIKENRLNTRPVAAKRPRPSTLTTPSMVSVTLPNFTDDPFALFDEMLATARSHPTQSLADHFQMLIGWLG